MESEKQFVIVVGSPIDGVSLTGPFDSPEEAMTWAADLTDESWWVADLNDPMPDPFEVPQVQAPAYEPEF